MAFLMSFTALVSHGWITRDRGSGEVMEAICWMGVGLP